MLNAIDDSGQPRQMFFEIVEPSFQVRRNGLLVGVVILGESALEFGRKGKPNGSSRWKGRTQAAGPFFLLSRRTRAFRAIFDVDRRLASFALVPATEGIPKITDTRLRHRRRRAARSHERQQAENPPRLLHIFGPPSDSDPKRTCRRGWILRRCLLFRLGNP